MIYLFLGKHKMSLENDIIDEIFEGNSDVEDDVVFTTFPHFPMTYMEIMNLSRGNYLFKEGEELRKPTNKEINEARKFVRDQFTGMNDISINKVKKSRK